MVTKDCLHVRRVCTDRVSLPAIDHQYQGINIEQRKLQQLIGLLKQTEPQKKVLDSSPAVSQTGQWPSVHRVKGQSLPPETSELQRFCLQYHAERNFSKHACHKKFLELFTLLIKLRLCNRLVHPLNSHVEQSVQVFADVNFINLVSL
ncbi:uncharacterized protein LOC127864625 [Dreissena polymorpha]|uniref:uncharacterized protein LOC127864625 n=1 Tax=Dreissena polymorpha TaxID=45954 RepID=UPI002264726C|nr:uncharacterized protein LOC127864625 [Dreissena polymorpha]